ncbi:hypothetical protein CC80DRAFT_176354 [Byssothecium circinans]|uniref:Uncharacterized protein n=1 Tax=Byssothecium circinans TaxID=147558 RepID=A0A6A5TJJ3_9PLEO|nr:hypothetical protein CC80DRAFT_176354 [Byssothecium circinans]
MYAVRFIKPSPPRDLPGPIILPSLNPAAATMCPRRCAIVVVTAVMHMGCAASALRREFFDMGSATRLPSAYNAG